MYNRIWQVMQSGHERLNVVLPLGLAFGIGGECRPRLRSFLKYFVDHMALNPDEWRDEEKCPLPASNEAM